jgi:hypothetical protein
MKDWIMTAKGLSWNSLNLLQLSYDNINDIGGVITKGLLKKP